MWAIFVLDENIRCFISLRRDRCTKKTLIQGTSPPGNGFRWSIGPNVPFVRKMKLFTDEWHLLVAVIRKYGVFADGHALPVRDTGFWAENGVSLQGKASISTKPARDTDFWTGKGVSLQEKQFNARKPVNDCSIAPDDNWVTVKISRL